MDLSLQSLDGSGDLQQPKARRSGGLQQAKARQSGGLQQPKARRSGSLQQAKARRSGGLQQAKARQSGGSQQPKARRSGGLQQIKTCACGYKTFDSSNFRKHINLRKHVAVTMAAHDVTKGAHDVTKGAHDVTMGAHDVNMAAHDKTKAAHDKTMETHDVTMAAHDITMATHDVTMGTHADDKRPEDRHNLVVCEYCGRGYKTKFGLRLHVKNKHEVKFKHVCDTCGKCFNQTTQYRYHCSQHTKTSLDKCADCGVEFFSPASKSRHKKVCDPTKVRTVGAYACDQCNASYSRLDLLRDHVRGKHGEPRFECRRCGNKYAWRSSLKAHTSRGVCIPKEECNIEGGDNDMDDQGADNAMGSQRVDNVTDSQRVDNSTDSQMVDHSTDGQRADNATDDQRADNATDRPVLVFKNSP